MKKLLVLAWAGAALLSGGMLRADNLLLSTRNSSLLLTAEKGQTPLFQSFGARVASPDDILASGAAFGDAAYPQFGAQCYREVAIQATHGDGSMSLELAVESVSRDRRDGSETTAIAMKDKHYPFFVTLFYKTYDDCEVIETWTEIRMSGFSRSRRRFFFWSRGTSAAAASFCWSVFRSVYSKS